MTAQERPVSKAASKAYCEGWEKIFGKKSNSDADSTPPDILPAEDSNTSN